MEAVPEFLAIRLFCSTFPKRAMPVSTVRHWRAAAAPCAAAAHRLLPTGAVRSVPSSGAAEPDSTAGGRWATGYGAAALPSAAGAKGGAPRARPASGPGVPLGARMGRGERGAEGKALLPQSFPRAARALRLTASLPSGAACGAQCPLLWGPADAGCLFRIYEHKNHVDTVLNIYIFFTFVLFWSISIFNLCLTHCGNKDFEQWHNPSSRAGWTWPHSATWDIHTMEWENYLRSCHPTEAQQTHVAENSAWAVLLCLTSLSAAAHVNQKHINIS